MTVRAALQLSADTPLVVCLLNGEEPPESLTSAFSVLKRLPDLHLVLLSTGRAPVVTETLRRGIRNGVDRIHAVGLASPDAVIQQVSGADVGLVPEGAVASSAQAVAVFTQAGLPIIVPDSSGQAHLVARTRAGVVYPAGRVPELAKAMRATTRRRAEFASRIDAEARETSQPVSDELFAASSGPLACTRVGIGPANYASQANEWSRALREILGVEAESFSLPGNARRLPDRLIATSGQADLPHAVAEMEIVLGRYSHLLVDAFMDVLAGIVADDIAPEIAILERNGTRLGLIAHGSEVRLPQRHMDRIPHSFFFDAPSEWVNAQTAQCLRNAETAASFDGPVFVSTPDLLLDLPGSRWLPVVIPEPGIWDGEPILEHSGPVRVLHRPSRTEPPIKGSEHILPVLERLQSEGLVEMVHSPERVAPERMPDLIRSADVLVDQIQTGSYGVVSVEAMWAGRAVVGWVAPDVRAIAGEDIPIVDAAPADFETVLRDLVSRRADLQDLAGKGREYAHRVHDGRRSAEVLRAFVESPVRI